jgi:hypothetical protein
VSGDACSIRRGWARVIADIDDRLLGIEAGGTLTTITSSAGAATAKPNMTVTGEIEGFFGGGSGATSKKPLTFTTNLNGEICVAPCTDANRGLTIPYDPQMITSTAYFVTLKQVNGTDIARRTRRVQPMSKTLVVAGYSVGGSIAAGVNRRRSLEVETTSSCRSRQVITRTNSGRVAQPASHGKAKAERTSASP